MGRTVKQQGRERARKKKAESKRIWARQSRGKNRTPLISMQDMEKRLKRGMRQMLLKREINLRNRHLNTTKTPKPTKKGLLSRIGGFFTRKKGPK